MDGTYLNGSFQAHCFSYNQVIIWEERQHGLFRRVADRRPSVVELARPFNAHGKLIRNLE